MKGIRNKNKKFRIGIFYGGPSDEHNVSVSSAKSIIKNIDRSKYVVKEIKISKTGKWPNLFRIDSLKSKLDFALIVMHGQYGEDGVIQAIFESIKLPYSGSGVLASSLAMDKYRSQILAQKLGIRVPKTWLIGLDKINPSQLPKQLVIKPNNSGSSNGVKLITRTDFEKNIRLYMKKYYGCLLQERIYGREFTVPVLGKGVLPIVEIISENVFYDYDAKYSVNKSRHILNPPLPERVRSNLLASTSAIHNLLGCKAMSRSDFLLQDGELYYLETNTIPGMTATSLLPESARFVGISYTKLIDKIIKASL